MSNIKDRIGISCKTKLLLLLLLLLLKINDKRHQLFELIVEVFCIRNIVLYQLYKTSILVFLTIFTSVSKKKKKLFLLVLCLNLVKECN